MSPFGQVSETPGPSSGKVTGPYASWVRDTVPHQEKFSLAGQQSPVAGITAALKFAIWTLASLKPERPSERR